MLGLKLINVSKRGFWWRTYMCAFVNFGSRWVILVHSITSLVCSGFNEFKFSGNIPDSKVHGANMGPIWGRQDPGGPHVSPMNFAIWDSIEGRLDTSVNAYRLWWRQPWTSLSSSSQSIIYNGRKSEERYEREEREGDIERQRYKKADRQTHTDRGRDRQRQT